ncbi:cysteine desulfurase [Gammaproteobacteria bacterium]|nr:cysteine desulfurase [Gammaproteobacteria bacterium]
MTPGIAATSVVPVHTFDVERIRTEFPALQQKVHGKPLVYLDNAATTQKPNSVIEAIERYYYLDNANVHRGVHELSERATDAYEGARETIRSFLGADSVKEIIYTSGTTESINLVAYSWARSNIKAGDAILITEMEHHSNIVPWQLLCQQTGAVLKVAPINDRGELILEEFEKLLAPNTKFVAMVHVSNALGTINPVKQMIRMAHSMGAVTLVDAAQAAPHIALDVKDLDCDFLAISSHKIYGPTGIGVLYAKEKLLEKMPPFQAGGDMIDYVSFDKTTFNKLPYKFEAGTPHIAGAIGFCAALNYVQDLGLGVISAHERGILQYATQRILEIPGVSIIGSAALKCGVLSFTLEDAHPSDIGTILNYHGVAIRTGHHCAMPVMQHFRVPGTARASFALYNNRDDVDVFIAALKKAKDMLA